MHTDILLRSPAQTRIDIDRYFFTFMAGLFLLTATIGFAPRSAAILTGVMPNPPLAVHLHAALMSAWLVLLVAQSGLVAARHRRLHMTLGMSTMLLVPAMLITMVAAATATYPLMMAAGVGDLASNILILQGRGLMLFTIFFVWGFLTRRSDRATHKRMMLMSTFVVIDAAVSRMTWLPGNDITQSYEMSMLYTFLLLLPALAYDMLKLGKVHKAYVQALALYLPWAVLTSVLWNAPGWLEMAPRLMGY